MFIRLFREIYAGLQLTKHVIEIPADNPVLSGAHENYDAYGYSPAVRAGNLLFIAGEVGIRPDGTIPDTAAEQTEVALQRTAEVLRLHGLTMDALVDVVSYHIDLAANIADFLPIKARFTSKPYPAWSIIGVQALAVPELKIEIKSIAVFPDTTSKEVF